MLLPKLALLVALSAPTPLAVPSTRLWISGTSNLHDWKCEADAARVRTSVAVEGSSATGLLPRAVEVVVPVSAIECGNGTMNEKLRNALKADASPEIHFLLATARAVPPSRVLAEGELTIAGVSRKVGLLVSATPADGHLRVAGSLPVQMSDYGVEPPTALLGALKTGDQVVVHFELELAGP